MDNTGSTPANADNTAADAATEVDSEVAQTGSESTADSATETGAVPDPKRDKIQERFDTLTREKYEGLSRAERAEYRAQLAEQRLAELDEKAKTQTVAPSSDYPTLESVGHDYDEHAKAVAAWAERRATAATQAALEADRKSTESQRAAQTWQQAQAEFIKSTPDYVTKVQNAPTLPISQEAQERIARLPDGPRIAYTLVENAEKARAIMHLPIDVQMLEIGRIAGRIESKPAPVVVSKAPPPVAKIDAGEAAQKKAWNDPAASQEEFNREREKFLKRHR